MKSTNEIIIDSHSVLDTSCLSNIAESVHLNESNSLAI